MQRGAIGLALLAVLSLGACKDKKKSAPSPSAGSAIEPGAGGPATAAARPRPAGPPPSTEPDTTYEERRRLLILRGDPEMMKEAPVYVDKAPDIKPEQLIKPLGKDLLQVGTIKVDLAKGRAEVAGKVSAIEMPLEYIAVTPNGKAYESLFTIDTSAIELRLALSLMGYEGTTPQDLEGKVSPATADDSVFLAVIVGGKERPVAAFLIDKKTRRPPKDAPYQVIGFLPEFRDQALLTKDFITLVPRDVAAPVRYSLEAGNPYAGPKEGYTGNKKALPAEGTAVTLVIKRHPDKTVMPSPTDLVPPGTPTPGFGPPVPGATP